MASMHRSTRKPPKMLIPAMKIEAATRMILEFRRALPQRDWVERHQDIIGSLPDAYHHRQRLPRERVQTRQHLVAAPIAETSVVKDFGTGGGRSERGPAHSVGLVSGAIAVKQATRSDDLSFDRFSLFQDCSAAPYEGIGRREVLQALVQAPMDVVINEGVDPLSEVAWQVVVFTQNSVLERLAPQFDLASVCGRGGELRTWSIF